MHPAPASTSLSPLDAGFLRGAYTTLFWFGALWTVAAGVVTQSLMVAGSFAAGVMLAAALLKTHEIVAGRLVQKAAARRGLPEAATAPPVKLPLFVLIGAKYLIVAALLGWTLSNGWLRPAPFALGFTLLQVVLVGKVLGRLLHARMRPLREVYVRPAAGRTVCD